LGDREFSDNERKRQIKEVIADITPATVIWGHGFGNGVESRPIHMEISYLEIFHKQGLIGLGTWVFLFTSLVGYFISLPLRSPLSYAFFLAAIFIFFQSLTNQYINNPIGMGMFLISLTGLDALGKSPIRDDITTRTNS
jgi:O-antigen ligase